MTRTPGAAGKKSCRLSAEKIFQIVPRPSDAAHPTAIHSEMASILPCRKKWSPGAVTEEES